MHGLVSGQTMRSVLETILANNVSQNFASKHIVATDFDRGDWVIENKSGQLKVFPFDVATFFTRKQAACRPPLFDADAGISR